MTGGPLIRSTKVRTNIDALDVGRAKDYHENRRFRTWRRQYLPTYFNGRGSEVICRHGLLELMTDQGNFDL